MYAHFFPEVGGTIFASLTGIKHIGRVYRAETIDATWFYHKYLLNADAVGELTAD